MSCHANTRHGEDFFLAGWTLEVAPTDTKRLPPPHVWCSNLLYVVLSSILNPPDASMIVKDILVIPTSNVLESRGALHHMCGVALSSVSDTDMTVLLT